MDDTTKRPAFMDILCGQGNDCMDISRHDDECGNCGAVVSLGQVCECAGGTEGSGDWDEDASVQS